MEIEQGSTLHASTNTMNATLTLIQNLEAGSLLTRTQAESLMGELLSGRVQTPEIVRLLQALNSRPLVAAELASFARVLRRHAAPVFPAGVALPEKMVDTCGTGGDGSGTFNISTAAAIVASAAGARVAKHGNRSVSSRCGSADVLEVIGIRIDLPLEHAGRSIREIGIGFLFAPAAHAATRHVIPARKQIARRTVFNLLGPLTNPAGAQRQVLGVFSADVMDLVAATLAALGVERALVLHGAGGLDEISPAGEISSRPPAPWSTRARSTPSSASVAASKSTISAENTPRTWHWAPAGFVSGPRRLKTVRRVICLRAGIT